MHSNWSQSRVCILEQEVLSLQTDRNRLLAEKKGLEKEMSLLVERLLNEKATVERIKISADRHLDALHCLLHSQGCGCTGQCEKGSQQPS